MLSLASTKRRSPAARPSKGCVSVAICSEADQDREGGRGGEESDQDHYLFEEIINKPSRGGFCQEDCIGEQLLQGQNGCEDPYQTEITVVVFVGKFHNGVLSSLPRRRNHRPRNP